jgi:hypothetical protein
MRIADNSPLSVPAQVAYISSQRQPAAQEKVVRIVKLLIAISSLLLFAAPMVGQTPSTGTASGQAQKADQHSTNAATGTKTQEQRSHEASKQFDTRGTAPAPVKAETAPKRNPVGDKVSDYKPQQKSVKTKEPPSPTTTTTPPKKDKKN